MSDDRKDICVRDMDVLFVRGGKGNKHPGNLAYRKLVKQQKLHYSISTEKQAISHAIVAAIRKKGGRFLQQNKLTRRWYEVSDKEASKKTSQALREGQAELLRAIATNSEFTVDTDPLGSQLEYPMDDPALLSEADHTRDTSQSSMIFHEGPHQAKSRSGRGEVVKRVVITIDVDKDGTCVVEGNNFGKGMWSAEEARRRQEILSIILALHRELLNMAATSNHSSLRPAAVDALTSVGSPRREYPETISRQNKSCNGVVDHVPSENMPPVPHRLERTLSDMLASLSSINTRSVGAEDCGMHEQRPVLQRLDVPYREVPRYMDYEPTPMSIQNDSMRRCKTSSLESERNDEHKDAGIAPYQQLAPQDYAAHAAPAGGGKPVASLNEYDLMFLKLMSSNENAVEQKPYQSRFDDDNSDMAGHGCHEGKYGEGVKQSRWTSACWSSALMISDRSSHDRSSDERHHHTSNAFGTSFSSFGTYSVASRESIPHEGALQTVGDPPEVQRWRSFYSSESDSNLLDTSSTGLAESMPEDDETTVGVNTEIGEPTAGGAWTPRSNPSTKPSLYARISATVSKFVNHAPSCKRHSVSFSYLKKMKQHAMRNATRR